MMALIKKNFLLLALTFLLGFGGHWVFQSFHFSILSASAQDRYADLQNFSKVLNMIQQYYVEPVDIRKLIYGAIKGMLRELDPHTNFMPPDIFKDFEAETSGEFGGLGIEITLQNGILTIISPIEDTPAWEAGIKPGDKVLAVDGKATKGLSLVEASQLMRGKKGSKINLTIGRENEENPRDIVITRGNVKVKSVKTVDLEDGYQYVKITSFIENTSKDLEKFLEEATKKKGGLKGIIMDLRRNPGGLLDQAIKVSDLFLKEGDIVSTVSRDPASKEVVSATKQGKYTEVPLIILVNEFSASASEIVAGALQDNKRALVMGNRTFGKGSVQSVVKLGDGSGLKLTVARYFTPSGRSIQAEGVSPDIELEELDPEALTKAANKKKGIREKDIEGHLIGENEKDPKKEPKKDTADTKKESAEKDNQKLKANWWKESVDPNAKNLSPKDKLISSDYQVFHAYNYVKAWKVIRGL